MPINDQVLILCITGDSVKAGDQQETKAVHEFEAVRLLKQIQSFNQGIDPTFEQLPDKSTKIFSGAAVDPSCRNQRSLKIRTIKKKEAGANFLQTQIVMDRKCLAKKNGRIKTFFDAMKHDSRRSGVKNEYPLYSQNL